MFGLSEFEFYGADFNFATDDDFDFYYDDIIKARRSCSGIMICWIVPDCDCGHIEYRCFDTWDDAHIWLSQC